MTNSANNLGSIDVEGLAPANPADATTPGDGLQSQPDTYVYHCTKPGCG